MLSAVFCFDNLLKVRNDTSTYELRCAFCLFFKLLRNLRCALCLFSALAQFALRSILFFQRLRNLRLRIGKSNICYALIANFFQDAQSQNNF